MIVGRSFDGDDDDRTKWDQHDVYPRALSIIVDGCRAHVRFAVNLLEVSFPARWQSEDFCSMIIVRCKVRMIFLPLHGDIERIASSHPFHSLVSAMPNGH